jgi:hypothetical protein
MKRNDRARGVASYASSAGLLAKDVGIPFALLQSACREPGILPNLAKISLALLVGQDHERAVDRPIN